jgi:hypothetical protein
VNGAIDPNRETESERHIGADELPLMPMSE